VNQVRSPRGPKKGHLKALRNRIGLLTVYPPAQWILTSVVATLESIISCDQSNSGSKALLGESDRHIAKEEMRQTLSPPQEYSLSTTVAETHSVSNSFEESPTNVPITPPDQESSDLIEADL
jgi:hypothetical protein